MPKFEIGNPGKPKGALNKRSKEFLEVLEKHNFCPASALIECYLEAKKTYDNYAIIYESIEDARIEKGLNAMPTEDKADKYLKIAADIAKDLSSYAYPKLKSVEKGPLDVTKEMTPEQRLEAMKHAVQMLELQIKDRHGSGIT